MKATICRPRDLGASEIDLWHGFQAAAGLDNPFLSPEFARVVDEFFSSSRVAVVYDGVDLVGFLPFSAHRFRAASGIGEGLSNLQAFIPGGTGATFEEVVRAAKIELFEFRNLLASQCPVTGTSRQRGSWLIDLSHGFEHYLASARLKGGRFVKTLDQKRRSIERNDPNLRFEFDCHDVTAVGKLFEWKLAQARNDRLAREGVREVVERIASTRSDAMSGSVSCLRSGDQLLAGTIDLRSTTMFGGWMSAYDVHAGSKSPGAVCLLYLIEAVAEAGLESFDLGPGDDDYKRRLATDKLGTVAGWVGHAGVGRRLSERLRRHRGRSR